MQNKQTQNIMEAYDTMNAPITESNDHVISQTRSINIFSDGGIQIWHTGGSRDGPFNITGEEMHNIMQLLKRQNRKESYIEEANGSMSDGSYFISVIKDVKAGQFNWLENKSEKFGAIKMLKELYRRVKR